MVKPRRPLPEGQIWSNHQSTLLLFAGIMFAATMALIARGLPWRGATGEQAPESWELIVAAAVALAGLGTVALLLVQAMRTHHAFNALLAENRALAALKERADEASRTKTQFLSNMSHEIRTPLNGIIGTLQIIDPTSLTRENRDSFEIVRRSSLSLLDIVNGILDMSKIEADEVTLVRRTFELRPFISDILTQHGVQASEKDLAVLVRCDPSLPARVHADPGKIEQILNNLLSNAIKFTAQGSITLEIARCGGPASATGSDYPDGVAFTVSDTGIGIAAEDLARLFQPFRQIDGSLTRRYAGSGLGLSIVRRLATMMGGEVRVESSPDEGASFRVIVPGAVPAAAGHVPGDPAEDQPDVVLFGGRYATIFRACQVMLQLGARVKVIETEEEASTFAGAVPASVRVAIADRRFGGNALELLERLAPAAQGGWQIPTVIIQNMRPKTVAQPGYVAGELVEMFSRSSLLDILKRSGVLDGIGRLRRPVETTGRPVRTMEHLKPLKVLVVDDNAINRRVLERLLRNMGITSVATAGNAVEAFDQLARGGVSLVLMDIQMPDIDGYSAARIIRQKGFASVRIVACSAHAFEADVLRSAAEGLDGHVSKPVVAAELEELLERLFPAPAGDAGDVPD